MLALVPPARNSLCLRQNFPVKRGTMQFCLQGTLKIILLALLIIMEEAGLLGQLGINWKLFLSQSVNFFVLLLVLRFFVYKPLIEIIKKRNSRIKEGLDKAEEADVRLKEIDNIGKEKIKEADNKALLIIKETEQRAKVLDNQIQQRAEAKQKEINELLRQSALKQKEESESQVYGKALELVKQIVAKTVELKPEAIDKALVEKAVSEVKKEVK